MQRRKTAALQWLANACLCLMAGGASAQSGSADPAAGSGNRLDVAAQSTLENEVVLPNCQRISTREETRRVHVDRGANHPPTLVVDGVRWEHYRIDCPSWQGWVRP